VARSNKYGKLTANSKGSYVVTEEVGLGTYQPTTTQGTPLPRAWNNNNLRKYYT